MNETNSTGSSEGDGSWTSKMEHNGLLMSNRQKSDAKARDASGVSHKENQIQSFASHKPTTESLDFEEVESIIWRKHHLRRYFQDKGVWWTASRQTIAWRWFLVLLTGVLIAVMGALVQVITQGITDWKFKVSTEFIVDKKIAEAFFSYVGICLFYSFVAGCLCMFEPAAAGSGIPEIKAYLNGVNLDKVVQLRVLYTKVLGMCLSVASGLPLGKEGPMIHAGSIIGATVSQGNTVTFGFNTSWTKFQDLRNDRTKRDFVTFGAAAGIAAAFRAPIGGILFVLEEGASYWSTTLTFRAFLCALITQLSFTIIFNGFTISNADSSSEFQFGTFDTFIGYRTYELVIFTFMGVFGGLMGALFNHINKRMTQFRINRYKGNNSKRFLELMLITGGFATISFLLPLMWLQCTDLPVDTGNWTPQEYSLLGKLVQFTCPANQYNELASLYFVSADTSVQQLYHFKEINGTSYPTFGTGCLFLFFIPYFLFAAITSGTLCPAGLFVPTLLAGAAYGRIVGHILNLAFPYFVADSGTYALIGAAAMLGGVTRSTIAGTVIVLEACGNNAYILPLMLTFAAARYSGNPLGESIYDMQIELKQMPFLEGTLKGGLLNYHPITDIMARPVATLKEINSVGDVYEILSLTSHNGYPVVSENGHLKGFILRKTLCGLMKLKAFSSPASNSRGYKKDFEIENEMHRKKSLGEDNHTYKEFDEENKEEDGGDDGDGDMITLTAGATVFHQTLEKNYPNYPSIRDIELNQTEMSSWLDIRPYMDSAPYSINESSSVKRCYRFFRTMGLRHLVVVDGDHRVTGMITRNDITQHTLHNHWVKEGDNMSKFVNIDAVMEPAQISQPHHPPRDSSGMPVADGNESSSWFKDRHGSIDTSSASPPHLSIHATESSYSPDTKSERSSKSAKKTKSKEPKSYKSNT
eukprot:CAMPEP_0119044320 /NCGR_PEP_ID=MMETSP1177-20130426/30604_1 /TAXON_ID=2985 /ORGANISM="Ochromonas sp, Strain CCMP1899" /LENGTH=923 /DNA_ID=CAMNT_0007014267 /DNA_START=18 /DNA_END=2789 /DNA_ORIENTATION=-